jgi:hypothetical protein
MYKFDINTSKKLFHITAEGMFDNEMGEAYLRDYKKNLSKINPSEYVLLVDSRKQITINPQTSELLGETLKMYMDAPFKKRYVVKIDSVIAMSQVKRLAGPEFSQKIELVDTPEEIINRL